MKKLSIIGGVVGLMLIVSGCSSTKETKEVKIIHEHHIYVHNVNQANKFHRMNSGMRQKQGMSGRRFNNPKGGIDPRYDHKPGQGRPNGKLGNPKSGIDPRYDHKPGMMPPKKENK